MQITSSAFQNGGRISRRYTCEGANVSPAFSWSDIPKETKSLVLILHDPDAPRANGFVHWVVYNISPKVDRIPENVTHHAAVVGLGSQGKNDSGKIGYVGPCPPSGTHRYFARLYSLRNRLDLKPGCTYKEVLAAMEDKTIEFAEMMGTYSKELAKAA